MTRGPQKQFDREEVLDRAMTLFWSHGYDGAGMTQLVEAMGIGRQSLYDTFGDKRALFQEAIRHYLKSQIAAIVAILRAPGSPIGNLKRVFERWETMTEQERNGCLIGNSVAEFGGADREMAAVLGQCVEGMENEFFQLVRRAREAGEISSALSDRDLARLIVHTTQGLALLSKINTDPEVLRSVQRGLMAALGTVE